MVEMRTPAARSPDFLILIRWPKINASHFPKAFDDVVLMKHGPLIARIDEVNLRGIER